MINELRVGGERADYPAGTTVYQPGSEPRAALVVRGLLRVFLASLEGRQVTVRYARPGDVLGIAVLVGGPVSVRGAGGGAIGPVPAQLPHAARRCPPRCPPQRG